MDTNIFNFKDLFTKLRQEGNLDNETYSLKIITSWLKSKDINYKYSSSSIIDPYLLYEHGIIATIGNKQISIQTHPLVAGYAFAETLISDNMLSDTRHDKPDDLFEFLTEIMTTEIIEDNEDEKEKMKEEEKSTE